MNGFLGTKLGSKDFLVELPEELKGVRAFCVTKLATCEPLGGKYITPKAPLFFAILTVWPAMEISSTCFRQFASPGVPSMAGPVFRFSKNRSESFMDNGVRR